MSVILAGYADKQRLEEAMSWAAEQVLEELELELVIVGSRALVGWSLGQHRAARVVTVERDPGQAGATDRELGFGAARGEFVAFLEPGDEWYRDHLERLVQLLADEPGLGLAFGPVAEVRSQAGTQVRAPDVERLRSQGRAVPSAEALAGVLPKWTISGIVARREALLAVAPSMLFDRSQDQALDRQKWAELTGMWSIDGIAAIPSESAKALGSAQVLSEKLLSVEIEIPDLVEDAIQRILEAAHSERVLQVKHARSTRWDAGEQAPSGDLVRLDAALNELGESEPELVKLVELRFFGGLRMEDVASILGISLRSAQRSLSFVMARLRNVLAAGA